MHARASLDAARIRAAAKSCGKPMTVWSYTLPSAFGREAAAGCGLFVDSNLRNIGVAMGKLAGYAEALQRQLPESFAPVCISIASTRLSSASCSL